MRRLRLQGMTPWLAVAVLVGYVGVASEGVMDEARAASVDMPRDSVGAMSPIYAEKLKQSLRGFDTPRFGYMGLPQTRASSTSQPPLSFDASICLGSICWWSVCLGSLCLGSWCVLSDCGSSHCAASHCSDSSCEESNCLNSQCVSTVCQNHNCPL